MRSRTAVVFGSLYGSPCTPNAPIGGRPHLERYAGPVGRTGIPGESKTDEGQRSGEQGGGIDPFRAPGLQDQGPVANRVHRDAIEGPPRPVEDR